MLLLHLYLTDIFLNFLRAQERALPYGKSHCHELYMLLCSQEAWADLLLLINWSIVYSNFWLFDTISSALVISTGPKTLLPGHHFCDLFSDGLGTVNNLKEKVNWARLFTRKGMKKGKNTIEKNLALAWPWCFWFWWMRPCAWRWYVTSKIGPGPQEGSWCNKYLGILWPRKTFCNTQEKWFFLIR